MRVLHLRASNFYGGPERQIHLHAAQSKGTDITIILSSFLEHGKKPEFLETASFDGIETHVFPMSGPYDRSVINKIRSYVTSACVDILCTHEYRSHLIGCLATRRSRTKWLAFSRGWTTESMKIRAYHGLDKVIIRLASQIVAVSGAQKEKLTRLRIPESKITVVHNAVNVDRNLVMERVNLRRKFMLSEGARVVVCAGRFSSEKGQIFFVKAAEAALKVDERLRFIMFGDGPDLRGMKNVISRMGLHDRVFCPGFEKNAIGCIKDADMLVNPSLSEGLPNVVLEAMALNVPVVATDVGGVSELIKNGHTGWLVPAADAEALKDAIIDVVTNAAKAKQCADNAKKLVEQQFNFRVQYEKLRNIYLKVITGE